jgi:hypothetical protein
MKEKLQAIIEQRIISNEAVTILRSAIEELSKITAQSIELGQLIAQAEDVFLYGKDGRPIHRTFR